MRSCTAAGTWNMELGTGLLLISVACEGSLPSICMLWGGLATVMQGVAADGVKDSCAAHVPDCNPRAIDHAMASILELNSQRAALNGAPDRHKHGLLLSLMGTSLQGSC